MADINKFISYKNLEQYTTLLETEKLSKKSDVGHTHAVSDVTGLSSALEGKQGSLSTTQLQAVNSGITSTLVSKYNGYEKTLEGKVDKDGNKVLSTNDYTTEEKTKLAGIAANANNYTHPSYTAKTSGLYKVTVDATGHVSATTAVVKADITGLGIPSKDTTYGVATTSANGLMSSTDKSKLDGIESSADVNKIETIKVNSVAQPIVASDKSVDITIPTSVSELENDSGFKNEDGVKNIFLTEIGKLNLSTTYQPLDSDLTNIAALNGTGLAKRASDGTWSLDSNTYLKTSDSHNHNNLTLLETYTQTNSDISNAVAKAHTHSNGSVLDGITAQNITAWSNAQPNVITSVKVNNTALSIAEDKSVNITVPTNNNQLTNGAGYQTGTDVQNTINGLKLGETYQPLDADLTSIAGLSGTSGILKKTAANTWSLDTTSYATVAAVNGKYTKPTGGIPKTDLSSDVQTSLGKADTALQSFTETTLSKGTSTGTGNAVTDISVSNHQVTLTLGKTFIESSDKESSVTESTTKIPTSKAVKSYVDTAVQGIGNPMLFKGTISSGAYPTDKKTGDTYKVITKDITTTPTAKIGDTVIYDGTNWVVIPSGDEPNGTVTSVTAGTGLTGGTITKSGTIGLATSGVSAGTYKSVTVDTYGRVTAGSNPTTLSGYGITDAKIANGVVTLGSNTITPLTASSTLDATKLSGTIPSGCYTNTTYGVATTDANGLMSSADKTKLDGIAAGANNYSLPKASNTVLGGIKVGTNLSINTNGVLSATDTTYGVATTSANGLMSSDDKTKLDGIDDNANNYTHPSYTASSSGLYKVTVDGTGHVSATTAVVKADITGLGIPGSDTTYGVATTSANGLMSSTDKSKLDGIAANANNYTHPSYTSKTSGLYKITVDGTGHVSATTAVAKADITGLGIPGSDTTYSVATTTANGLMSSTDKSKLDGIASGANNYTHPTTTATTAGLYRVGKDAQGHVVLGDAFTIPTTLPASDVSAWAKAASKPSYTYTEVGAAPASHTHDDRYFTETEINTKLNNYALKTDIASVYRVKGTCTWATLIAKTDAIVGDVWNVSDKGGANYVCVTEKTAGEANWDKLGETLDLSGYATKATTLGGYGITDAKIDNGVVTLGSNTITPLTASSILNATKLSGTIPASCYTNTTYGVATTSANGLMSSTDKSKLDGIAANANNYTHPSYTAKTSGLYKVTVDATGHVSATTAVVKADITGLGIPGSDTTYSVATTSANGLMSSTDKSKLDGIATNANNYTHPSYTTKASGLYKITVDATGHVSAATAVAKADITGLGIPGSDTTYGVATTSANGLMSSTDKSKLDGIAANANNYSLPKASSTVLGGVKVGTNLSVDTDGVLSAKDTTYSTATASANGLMSSTDKSKLDGIATNANNYTHPAYNAKTSGLYKITVDATGHVSATTAVAKADITGLGIPGSDTTYGVATTSANGLMSSTDKSKLDGIAANANNYSHPTTTATTAGLYKVGKDVQGHVVLGDAFTIPTSLPASNVTDTYSSTGTAPVSGKAVNAALNTLGGASKLNVGTTSGTVAAGDHTHSQYLTASSTLNAAKLSGTIPSSCYTDTKYSEATSSAAGLLSAKDKAKIDRIGSIDSVTITLPTGGTWTNGTGTDSLRKYCDIQLSKVGNPFDNTGASLLVSPNTNDDATMWVASNMYVDSTIMTGGKMRVYISKDTVDYTNKTLFPQNTVTLNIFCFG